MQTIAVTAASGQLGGEIVKALDALNKYRIITLARTPSKAAHPGVEVRPGDYADRMELRKSLEGVNTILLVSGMDKPENRVGLHRNVIEAAKEAGVTKIVYTSIQGAEKDTAFSPIVNSNRQTEKDIRDSSLDWVIGRNGIYIEPDVEYIATYQKTGAIANCAGTGRCGYTTRGELAYAYACMLSEEHHNGNTYNLHGEAITQQELAAYLNSTFDTDLVYQDMSVADYRAERTAELGPFVGNIIAGIYEGIRLGASDNPSHFAAAAGREHQSWPDYFAGIKQDVTR